MAKAKTRFEPKAALKSEEQSTGETPVAHVAQDPIPFGGPAAEQSTGEPPVPQELSLSPDDRHEPAAEEEGEEVRSLEDLAAEHGQVIHADQLVSAGMELPDDVRTILAEIPVVKCPGALGYAAHEPDVRFDGRQALACKALTEGLAKAGAKLASGKTVTQQRDAVCWLMERIADAVIG